jgi:hypothetical protein
VGEKKYDKKIPSLSLRETGENRWRAPKRLSAPVPGWRLLYGGYPLPGLPATEMDVWRDCISPATKRQPRSICPFQHNRRRKFFGTTREKIILPLLGTATGTPASPATRPSTMIPYVRDGRVMTTGTPASPATRHSTAKAYRRSQDSSEDQQTDTKHDPCDYVFHSFTPSDKISDRLHSVLEVLFGGSIQR